MSFCRHLNQWSDLCVFKWSKSLPFFGLNAKQIEIIEKPMDFLNELKTLALICKKRITLSSLYIGTGNTEKDLISCLETVKQRERDLELNILLDYNRSTRITESEGIQRSTKTVLIPLTRIGAKISFYLTPNMSGWRKWMLSRRQKWNELQSLHHLKCYIFDDNLVISGANLSDIYFTNRQDRYVVIRNCPQLCDYFDELIQTIGQFSLQLQTDGHFQRHPNWPYDALNYFDRNKFKTEAKTRIERLNQKFRNKCDLNSLKNFNSIVFPLIQMKTLGINDDQMFTTELLSTCSPDADISLASGYFNLTEEYKQIILNRKSNKPLRLLMASEAANGFYGAKGLSAYIPSVYTYLSNQFLKEAEANGANVVLYAFDRHKWSFHAKGLWISLSQKYFLSTIGSPNFGYRSVYRDTEAQVVIVTTDQDLKQRLEFECNQLWKHSTHIDIDSQSNSIRIPFWVLFVAKYMKSYF